MSEKYYKKYLKYKKKFISFNSQSGGSVTPQQESIANGAGIIFVENYRNRTNTKYSPAVILFRDKHHGYYSDAGGTKDASDTNIKYTASRETIEETANTFRISPNSLNSYNAVIHSYPPNNYICYFIGIDSVQSSYYHDNIRLIASRNAPHVWLETDDMARIYIDDFITANGLSQRGDLTVNDANGRQINIFGRTKACIRNAILSNIIPNPSATTQPTINKINLDYNPNFTPSRQIHGFLVGTKCYYTH
jgi:hypothetical protein